MDSTFIQLINAKKVPNFLKDKNFSIYKLKDDSKIAFTYIKQLTNLC